MSGNKIGGRKAVATNKEKYGNTFYQRIGRVGGANGRTGGFAVHPELAKIAGAKGGRNSKRGANSVVNTQIEPRRERITDLYERGYSIPKIAEMLEVSPWSLRRWAKSNLAGYGAAWEPNTEEKEE